MNEQHFDQLVKGVKEMKRHIAGKTVRSAVSAELPVPNVRVIREAAHVSQSQFAKLGTVPHPPHRPGESLAQNRGIQPQSH